MGSVVIRHAAAGVDAAEVTQTGQGVVSDVPNSPVSLVLPDAEVIGQTASATVVDGAGDSQAVVQDVGVQGQRVAFIINTPTDPTEYRVGFDGAASLVVDSAGGVVALDGSGQVVAAVDAPWARDANGTEVPTRFVVEGSTLTQVVDHTTATFAYPITADPAVWSWWGLTLYLNKNQTSNVAFGAGMGAAASLWIPDPFLTKVVGSSLAAFSTYAWWAKDKGACLAYYMPRVRGRWVGGIVWHYYGGHCR